MEERKEAKKDKIEKEVVTEKTETPPPSAQPEEATPVVTTKPRKLKNLQTIITVAILSGIVLFFLGLGLGYLLGHSTATPNRNGFPSNGNFTPPSDGGRGRFYPNSGTDNNSSSNSSDSNSSNLETQTN